MTDLISGVTGLNVSEETLVLAFSEVDSNNQELDWDEFSELIKGLTTFHLLIVMML